MRQLGVGGPIDYGQGFGNGIELVGCRDCSFDTVWGAPGRAPFSLYGKKFLTMDATCKRNRFLNVTLQGHVADEVSNVGAGNVGTFYDIAHDTVEPL